VNSLLQRRDHLLAVNARLAIPLTTQPAQGNPYLKLVERFLIIRNIVLYTVFRITVD
jgi:hypothetical protein